jgi:heparosan-N-sulfate-glucuronate 5-epimerase
VPCAGFRHLRSGCIPLSRVQYYRRIASAYFAPGGTHLSFWHETPSLNPRASIEQLGAYYMRFSEKADYAGPHDSAGIPLLDYRGQIGRQYNPIAIAQWGLGNYNLFTETCDRSRKLKFLAASDWLYDNLQSNAYGLKVWNHHFDWEYRSTLRSPWYSGLAQGQGISLLLRAHRETANRKYLDAVHLALAAFHASTGQGGVTFTDQHGDIWFEEYIVDPPTHILNGFIWALWGIYDHWLATREDSSRNLYERATNTLLRNLHAYDFGFWSLYEQSGTRLSMIASPFYHRLHIVQLRVMHSITGKEEFKSVADRWERYSLSRVRRTRALFYKSAFKLCYY